MTATCRLTSVLLSFDHSLCGLLAEHGQGRNRGIAESVQYSAHTYATTAFQATRLGKHDSFRHIHVILLSLYSASVMQVIPNFVSYVYDTMPLLFMRWHSPELFAHLS